MTNASRQGDIDSGEGKIVNGAATVFINGQPAGLHISTLTTHSGSQPIVIDEFGYTEYGGGNEGAVTTEGSPSVFIEGQQLLRIGSSTSCNHVIISGSPDVFCP